MTMTHTHTSAAFSAKCQHPGCTEPATPMKATEYLPPIFIPGSGQLGSGHDPCFLCQKEMKPGSKRSAVCFSPQNGDLYDPRMIDDETLANKLELGFAHVGPECAKKVPKGYLEA